MGQYIEMLKQSKAHPIPRRTRRAIDRKMTVTPLDEGPATHTNMMDDFAQMVANYMQSGGASATAYDTQPVARPGGYGRDPFSQKGLQRKHTLDEGATTFVSSPFRFFEEGFFQDCALERPIMNTLIMPTDSILSMIPVRANNNVNQKYGFITALDVTQGDEINNGNVCDDCKEVSLSDDWCKLASPFGRNCISSQGIEVNELIDKACRGEYDDFYFVGSVRGVGFTPQMSAITDRNLIMAGALQKQWWAMGRQFQIEMLTDIWTGDPANDVGTVRKYTYGLTSLINGDYPNSGLPIESKTDDALCAALNSDVKDFGSECLGNSSANIVSLLEELEYTLYERARRTGLLPVRWGIFMPTEIWNEITKVWPCESADFVCAPGANTTAQLTLNSVGGDLYQVAFRERMRQSMTLPLNGRIYPVFLDEGIPITRDPDTTGATSMIESSIFFIPFTAAGQQVLWLEHKDYSVIGSSEVYGVGGGILPGFHLSELTWTDGGRWHHSFSRKNWCFKVTTKHEWRLIFIAPHLAGRIDNVRACPLQVKPRGLENGAFTGQLGVQPA